MRDRSVAQSHGRSHGVLDASNEDAVAVLHKLACPWPMHVMQGQLELGHQEDIEHVSRLAQRHIELAHNAGELEDHAQRLEMLSAPAAIEAAVHSEVADGLIV